MKQNKKIQSIHEKLWKSFLLIVFGIVFLLWLFQILFFNVFYKKMKEKEVAKKARTLAGYTDVQALNDARYEMSVLDGLHSELYFRNQNELQKSMEFYTPLDQMRGDLFGYSAVIRLIQKVDESKDGGASLFVTGQLGKEYQLMLYGVKVPISQARSYYVVTYSILSPTGATVAILAKQLLWVSAIAGVVALLLARYLSREIAHPLAEIAHQWERFAKGEQVQMTYSDAYEEIQMLSQRFSQTVVELEKTEQVRREFIAGVSHDLRTPLTMIKAYSELIRDISGDDKEKRDANLGIIIAETDRLSRLVSDSLDVSQLQAGAISLRLCPVDMKGQVDFALGQFAIFEGEYTFHVSYEGEDFTAMAHANKIQQVLYNFIGNAINYTGEGKEVFILLKEEEEAVAFFVKDTGSGIAQEDLARIWERYNRGSMKQKEQVISTGLGLAIAKEILLSHGAHFGVKSELGKGSTFWFSLPKSGKVRGEEVL